MGNSDCIFCKIVAGGIPSHKIYEDQACLAFLDIGPLAIGHVLLIPRTHAQTIDQMSSSDAGAMLANLPAIVRAVQQATGCAGVNVLQNNGKAAHQEVPHVHFHIIPRDAGDAFHFNWPAGKYSPGQAAELAARIASLLKS